MLMEIKITVDGVDELNNELEKRFGQENLTRVVDVALTAGAKVIKKELEKNFETFKQTGASRDEITISKPMTLNGVRSILIHWSGPKKRYSIIHLNEFGTIKNPSPRGKGAVERAIRSGQDEYFRVIKRELVKQL